MKFFRTVGVFLLALLCAVLPFTGGFLLSKTGIFPWAEPVLFACVVLVLILIVLSFILSARLSRRLNAMRVDEVREEMMARHAQAKENLARAQKQLSVKMAIGVCYIVFLLLLSFVIPFLYGLSGLASNSIYIMLVPTYIFYGFFSRLLRKREKAVLNGHLSREDFPRIYAVLDRVAKKLGITEPLTIVTDSQFNAGVFLDRNRHYVNLGVRLLSIVNENELEQLFIHELAHLSNRDVQSSAKMGGVLEFLVGTGEDSIDAATGVLFNFPTQYLSYCYSVTEMTTSMVKETRADAAIAQYGDPSAHVGLLAKMGFHELFCNELDRFITEPFFAPEEPQLYNAPYVAHFIRAAKEREDFWREILERELPTRMESHPTFGERWRALGKPDYETVFPNIESPDDFVKECMEATARVDSFVMEAMKEDYAEARKENYLKPLGVVEEWERNGKELLSMDRMAPIIEAYKSLNRYEDALELCDRLLASDATPVSLAYVKFVKGSELLNFYDVEGIRLLEEAAEANHNALEGAYTAIILFCRRMGMQEELEHYRKKFDELLQVGADTYAHAGSLNPGDKLSVESLPEGRAERAVEFIVGIGQGSVREIYLVRKTVTKDFFVSAYVIRFEDETEGEQIDSVMDQIFQYLDKSPEDWEYSLFLYEKSLHERIFKKLPACRIYSKS